MTLSQGVSVSFHNGVRFGIATQRLTDALEGMIRSQQVPRTKHLARSEHVQSYAFGWIWVVPANSGGRRQLMTDGVPCAARYPDHLVISQEPRCYECSSLGIRTRVLPLRLTLILSLQIMPLC